MLFYRSIAQHLSCCVRYCEKDGLREFEQLPVEPLLRSPLPLPLCLSAPFSGYAHHPPSHLIPLTVGSGGEDGDTNKNRPPKFKFPFLPSLSPLLSSLPLSLSRSRRVPCARPLNHRCSPSAYGLKKAAKKPFVSPQRGDHFWSLLSAHNALFPPLPLFPRRQALLWPLPPQCIAHSFARCGRSYPLRSTGKGKKETKDDRLSLSLQLSFTHCFNHPLLTWH